MTKRTITKGKKPVKARRQVKKAAKGGSSAKSDLRKQLAAERARAKEAKRQLRELEKQLRETRKLEKARERKAKEAKRQLRELEKQLRETRKLEKARERKAKAIRQRTEKGLKIKAKAKPDSEGFVPLNYKSPQQKAWETRRLHQYVSAGMSGLSALDYAPLNKDQANYLDQIAEDFGDGYLYLPKKERVDYFQRLFQSGSSRLARYLHFVQEMGYASRQARTALFSPRAIKV